METGKTKVGGDTLPAEQTVAEHDESTSVVARSEASVETYSHLVVIDRRTFVREALCAALRTRIGKRVAAVDGVGALAALPDDFDSPSTVVVYSTVGGKRTQTRDDLGRIRDEMSRCRVCLLADEPDRDCEELFEEYALQGVIPSSFDTQQILACLSMVETGVRFLPVDLRNSTLNGSDHAEESSPFNEQLGKLTPRQQQVMRYIAQGRSNKYIAAELSLCESTVKVHVSELMKRLGATSRTHAVYLLNRHPEPAS